MKKGTKSRSNKGRKGGPLSVTDIKKFLDPVRVRPNESVPGAKVKDLWRK